MKLSTICATSSSSSYEEQLSDSESTNTAHTFDWNEGDTQSSSFSRGKNTRSIIDNTSTSDHCDSIGIISSETSDEFSFLRVPFKCGNSDSKRTQGYLSGCSAGSKSSIHSSISQFLSAIDKSLDGIVDAIIPSYERDAEVQRQKTVRFLDEKKPSSDKKLVWKRRIPFARLLSNIDRSRNSNSRLQKDLQKKKDLQNSTTLPKRSHFSVTKQKDSEKNKFENSCHPRDTSKDFTELNSTRTKSSNVDETTTVERKSKTSIGLANKDKNFKSSTSVGEPSTITQNQNNRSRKTNRFGFGNKEKHQRSIASEIAANTSIYEKAEINDKDLNVFESMFKPVETPLAKGMQCEKTLKSTEILESPATTKSCNKNDSLSVSIKNDTIKKSDASTKRNSPFRGRKETEKENEASKIIAFSEIENENNKNNLNVFDCIFNAASTPTAGDKATIAMPDSMRKDDATSNSKNKRKNRRVAMRIKTQQRREGSEDVPVDDADYLKVFDFFYIGAQKGIDSEKLILVTKSSTMNNDTNNSDRTKKHQRKYEKVLADEAKAKDDGYTPKEAAKPIGKKSKSFRFLSSDRHDDKMPLLSKI